MILVVVEVVNRAEWVVVVGIISVRMLEIVVVGPRIVVLGSGDIGFYIMLGFDF